MGFPAVPFLLRRIAWSGLATLGLAQGAWAADCVGMRGGELLLTASSHCVGQMRGDPALRRQMVQALDGGAVLPARPAAADRGHVATRASQANLAHPLARLSQLNAQSRYLWSLGNPAPTYYGQAR
jgi:hypothetical protein